MMKTFSFCCLVLFTFVSIKSGYTQDTCKVLMGGIDGNYEGDCRKGKANGKGRATGTDLYIGEFKDGLPHGKGIYRWKNGDFYEGDWVRGKKEGKGGMSFKRSGKPDSVISGYWKNDLYSGLNIKPYIIHSRSYKVIKVSVSKNPKQSSNTIVIEIQNTTGGSETLKGTSNPKPEITDIAVQKGTYGFITKVMPGVKSTSQQLNQVEYPFRATIKVGDQEADVEITEPGFWKIFVNINN